MAYVRKTYDTWQLWTNYGYGWEHETTELSRKEYKVQVKCYREAVPAVAIRLKRKRERKEVN